MTLTLQMYGPLVRRSPDLEAVSDERLAASADFQRCLWSASVQSKLRFPNDEIRNGVRVFAQAWKALRRMTALGVHPTLVRFHQVRGNPLMSDSDAAPAKPLSAACELVCWVCEQRMLVSLTELHSLGSYPHEENLRKLMRSSWLAAALVRNRRQRVIAAKNLALEASVRVVSCVHVGGVRTAQSPPRVGL